MANGYQIVSGFRFPVSGFQKRPFLWGGPPRLPKGANGSDLDFHGSRTTNLSNGNYREHE